MSLKLRQNSVWVLFCALDWELETTKAKATDPSAAFEEEGSFRVTCLTNLRVPCPTRQSEFD